MRAHWRLLGAVLLCTSIAFTASSAAAQQAPPPRVTDFWNKEYLEGKALLTKAPSPLLVSAIEGRKPGVALDVGTGEGRNATFLAERGWTVTGVDLSDVAIEQARKNAAANGVKVTLLVEDLEAFDLGEEQWDLISSFYMHGWHARSTTDVAARISKALKPGGLLVAEGFANPPNQVGFQTEELARAFSGLRILQNERTEDHPAWYLPEKVPLVRFVAEKPR